MLVWYVQVNLRDIGRRKSRGSPKPKTLPDQTTVLYADTHTSTTTLIWMSAAGDSLDSWNAPPRTEQRHLLVYHTLLDGSTRYRKKQVTLLIAPFKCYHTRTTRTVWRVVVYERRAEIEASSQDTVQSTNPPTEQNIWQRPQEVQ